MSSLFLIPVSFSVNCSTVFGREV